MEFGSTIEDLAEKSSKSSAYVELLSSSQKKQDELSTENSHISIYTRKLQMVGIRRK